MEGLERGVAQGDARGVARAWRKRSGSNLVQEERLEFGARGAARAWRKRSGSNLVLQLFLSRGVRNAQDAVSRRRFPRSLACAHFLRDCAVTAV